MKFKSSGASDRKIDLLDRIARRVISLGGFITIMAVAAMLSFIYYEAYPLLKDPKLLNIGNWQLQDRLPNRTLSVGTDEYRESGYRISGIGNIDFVKLGKQNIEKFHIASEQNEELNNEQVTASLKAAKSGTIFYGLDSGRAGFVDVTFTPKYKAGKRSLKREVTFSPIFNTGASRQIKIVTGSKNEDGIINMVIWNGETLYSALFDPDEDEAVINEIDFDGEDVTAIAIKSSGEGFAISDDSGNITIFELDEGEAEEVETFKAADKKITAIAYLIGDDALITGSENGLVDEWFSIRHLYAKNSSSKPLHLRDYGKISAADEKLVKDRNYKGDKTIPSGFSFRPAGMKMLKVRSFAKHEKAVTSISVSPRNKGFLTASASGGVHYNHSTSGKTFNKLQLQEGVNNISFSPRGDGFLAVGKGGTLFDYKLNAYHPDSTTKTLFGSVWYEGYNSEELVWQSTGGSDEFEPKFSIWPLIFGTLKGTFYAMIFSVPIAILAALYLSQMAPTSMRNIVKPAIELMAAMPSVVVGFLAGLWLAPMIDRHLASFFLMVIALPVGWFTLIAIYLKLDENKRPDFSGKYELLWLLPIFLGSFIIAALLGSPIEALLFGGDIKVWLNSNLGIIYDPRNSIVVGFALGFAVIPIIFTISEDALSAVPKSITSAAFALAASPWQTALYVVLPAASPGIFAAVMLGLGRAVGETMIVLMATGNTPILDISPWTGFRAMSAAIAVEMPEAPVGSSLYRILFLVGFLLFCFTFTINTLASVISAKLRRKYSRF